MISEPAFFLLLKKRIIKKGKWSTCFQTVLQKKIDFLTTNIQRVLCPGALSLKDFQIFHYLFLYYYYK